ncbi:MAG: hypothetical protein L7F77_00970 [Candidatus Magnetominusculus sp. LBB02]|nr:hypothetical protein [Candidatus Magnetominusculus sp. LBB02]
MPEPKPAMPRPQAAGISEAPAKEPCHEQMARWSKWVKENPEQAAAMLKEWMGAAGGG